jgi:phage portal protein BeeE
MATRTDVQHRVRGQAGLSLAGTRSSLRRRSDYSFLVEGWTPPALPAPATESQALALPPFGRGLELLANALAGTDWYARRWDAAMGVWQRVDDQPAVLNDPYPISTPWHYRWAACEDAVLYGNHFALYGDVDYRTLRPGWLVPMPADQVWMLQDPNGAAWSWVVGGTELGPDQLLHVPFGARSGELLGRGKLAQYGEWLGGAVAAEEHAGSYFAGGALPPAVLQSPSVVTQDQAAELKSKWRAMTSDREPVVLPQGYTLTPVVSSAESAQLVESRQWNAETAAMVLGIPGWKLGLPGPSMTYQNVETADIDFVRDCLDRYAAPLSAAFSKWLMPRGVDVHFDYAGRMRADQRTTAEVLTIYVGQGLMSKDEARAVMGRPPLAETTQEGTTPEGVPELTPEEVTA